jgi:hypothetical protein
MLLPSRPPTDTIALFRKALPQAEELLETAGRAVRIDPGGECRLISGR